MPTPIITGRTLVNAGADCEAPRDPCVLFDYDSDTVFSAVFEVGRTVKQLKLFDAAVGDRIELEMVHGANGGTMFAPFQPTSVPFLSSTVTYMLVPWPGRYRLRLIGTPGTVFVVCEEVPCCNAEVIGAMNG